MGKYAVVNKNDKINHPKRGRYSKMCHRYLRNYNVHDCHSRCTFAHSVGELKIHKCTFKEVYENNSLPLYSQRGKY